ncbi:MAG: hypothetical protein DRQ40_06095, partial [Gammaproteobacteria bacterium]
MVNCIKRQKENYKGTNQCRCINKKAGLFRQIVTDEQCASCPVEVARPTAPVPCGELAKQQVVAIGLEAGSSPTGIVAHDGFPKCPFRFDKGGEYQCSMTNLAVDPEMCNKCDSDTREHAATLGEKMVNYFGAVRRWVANGRPSRQKEQIIELFENHCQQCDRYDKQKHACKNCGCRVSVDSSPLTNKLGMAT